MKKSKTLFTDGEGPIVYKDLAFDLMGRITFDHAKKIPGHDFFASLSLYDDLLAERGTAGYQAGDTLALVVPHFVAHELTNKDILDEAKKAVLVPGVKEYITQLQEDTWDVRLISTAYRTMWNLVGKQIHIPKKHIACTELDLDSLRKKFSSKNLNSLTKAMEKDILTMLPMVVAATKEIDEGKSVVDVLGPDTPFSPLIERLDQFYWKDLPAIGYDPLEIVRVVGGKRKIESAQRFANELGIEMNTIVYVGDSITDDALFKFLKAQGGLPIAINGNAYALRNAVVAVATTDMRNLRPILDAWHSGGKMAVEEVVKHQPESDTYHYAMIAETDPKKLLAVHKNFRTRVRGAAAQLG